MTVGDYLGGYSDPLFHHPLHGSAWIILANSRGGDFSSFIANPQGVKGVALILDISTGF